MAWNCQISLMTLLCLLQLHLYFSTFSVFNCGSATDSGWEITTDTENKDDARAFQNFLLYWQNNCENKYFLNTHNGDGGIGFAILNNLKSFIFSVELGKIYRPSGHWHWAEYSNQNNCSLGYGAIDCFFEPLSTCENLIINSFDKVAISNLQNIDVTTGKALALHLGSQDICTSAKYMKKSVQWVHGQYVDYLIRPRTDILPDIAFRVNEVFKYIKNSSIEATIGVHYRGQTPDENRKPADLDTYIEQVDIKANELKERGRIVTTVYFCSYDQSSNIRSAEYLNSKFPRPWRYIVLDHLTMGSIEAEWSLMKLYANDKRPAHLPSKRDQVMEFLADIEILAEVDVFIGSFSNIYALATLLRVAHGKAEKSSSCFVDICNYEGKAPTYCEGTEEAKFYWISRNGPGGYLNPSSF